MRLIHFKSVFIICVSLLFGRATSYAQELEEPHILVSLRMVGHQLLLSANDSTSRVLPIKKEKDGYRVEFENPFGFNPDDLVNTASEVFSKTSLSDGYIVEVRQCETEDVVYSYEIGDFDSSDIIPCRSRPLPEDCYSLFFTLLNPLDTNAIVSDVDVPAEMSKPKDSSGFQRIILVIVLLVVIIAAFFIWRRRKSALEDPNLIPLGDFHFDKLNTELLYNDQRIELSGKEAELLLLLYNAVNNTVERELILNKVWGDEGDYVGRTLDVFISKLRKKLEADSKVKIVNIRGVGYKLVLDV